MQCFEVHKGRHENRRVEERLELRIKYFQDEHMKDHKTILSCWSKVISLKSKMDQLKQQLIQRDNTILSQEGEGWFIFNVDGSHQSAKEQQGGSSPANDQHLQALQEGVREVEKTSEQEVAYGPSEPFHRDKD